MAHIRNGDKITNVAIHTTQGSYAGTISWFKNPGAIVSAYYVVRSSDGQTQMVKKSDMAYHVRSANSYTIASNMKVLLTRVQNGIPINCIRLRLRWHVTYAADVKVLDAADNNAGAAVYQWDWNGGKNQQWIFDAIIGEDSLVLAPNPVTSDGVKINYHLNNPSQHATMMLSDTYGPSLSNNEFY